MFNIYRTQILIVKMMCLDMRFLLIRFSANDGKRKIKAMLPATLTTDIISGKIQNLGLIRLLDYTVNDIPGKSEEK